MNSIGACTGVGASFLKEHNEESTFEFRGESDNYNDNCEGCDSDEKRGYNCYGSPNNDDKKEMNDLMLRFSNVGSSLSRTRTCTTTDTTTDESVTILNSKDKTVTVESIGVGNCSGNQHDPTAAATYDVFATTRKLLFGDDKTAATPTTAKIKNESSSFQCNNQSNVLCNNNIPCVVNPNDGDDDNNNINSSFLQWYSNPTSPHSGRSLMRSSFPPSKTMYSAAYGDDDDDGVGGDTRNNLEEDTVLSPASGGTIYKSHTAKNNTDAQNNGHREIRYWRQRLHHASKHYGKTHSSTADAYFNLGRAQLDLSSSQHTQHHHPRETSTTQQKHQYDLAIENLTIAHGIWERTHGPQHLAVGRALDSLALAIVRRANHDRTNSNSISGSSKTSNQTIDDLRYARRLLEQAFGVRAHHLGVWHVDTVETYNKLAGVLLHLGLLGEAARAYREVFLVRRAIFGNHHPSVAIAAHSLANCHYRRGGLEESLGWYKVALDIYEAMGLSYRHPAVIKLLRDQSRLEEFMELDP